MKSVVSEVEKQATEMINSEANKDLKLYGTQMAMPFDKNIIADYGMIGNSPSVSNGVLRFDVNGTFFNTKKNSSASFEPTDFSKLDTDGKEVWAVLSGYSLYTLIGAGLNELFGATQVDHSYYGAIIQNSLLNLTISTEKGDDLTLADFVNEVNSNLSDEF